MSTFGLKISESGADVNISGLDDTPFDSRYSSFMLLSKQTLEFNAPSGDTYYNQVETYTHSLGYPPFMLGLVRIQYGGTEYNQRIIPFSISEPLYGDDFNVSVDSKSKENTIDIIWSADETLFGDTYNLQYTVYFTVTLYIYAYKLGYTT